MGMSQKTRFTQSALAVAVALVSTQAWSAGFQLNEFSSSGLGRAYSGEGAIADDAGNASRNPALIMMFDRPTMSAGAVFVDPNVNISGQSPTGKSLNADNIAPTAWVPNFHFVSPINDQFGWGPLSPLTMVWRPSTPMIMPPAAWAENRPDHRQPEPERRLSPGQPLELWLGFDAVYAKAKIERYAGDLGQIVAGSGALPPQLAGPVSKIPADTQIAHLNGNAWGFGWNAGILYELDKNNRYGFTYRSEVKIDFDGNYKSSLPSAYNQILGNFGLPAGTNGQTTDGSLTLNLPEMWELSGYNRVAPQWAVHYSLTYTSWSQFQELKAPAATAKRCSIKMKALKTPTASRWVPPITTTITGPSVPVSPSMIARYLPPLVLSPSRIRIVCG
jgi:long-chain fatty acid transport protein